MSASIKDLPARAKLFLDSLLRKNRRQFQRFVGRAITPVFVGENVPESASLIDISLGGLALEYTAGRQPLKKVFAMDLRAEDGFHLGKVLLEKVSDKEIKETGRPHTRRLRAQFLNLSKAKANKLGKFLEIYQEKAQ